MLEHKLDKIFEEKIKTLKSSNFLVALSGGVDSMVLANLFLKNNLKLLLFDSIVVPLLINVPSPIKEYDKFLKTPPEVFCIFL